jgi:membrane-associated protease RseP (regulator of RpoE activity)
LSQPYPTLPDPLRSSPPSVTWHPAPEPPPARQAWGWHISLFLATVASVFGAGYVVRYDWLDGGLLAAGLIPILFAHEMGHYLACRYYQVDATLPFFIPSPWLHTLLIPGVPGPGLFFPLSFVGTFGAVIRIRGVIPHRRALFDIGIAGPLAGFAVCLYVLYLGLLQSPVVPAAAGSDPGSISLGTPLAFDWAASWLLADIPAGYTISLGPLGLAAWFGLLLTALNMIPIGQLDGGHVTYALLRDRAALVSRIGAWVCLLLVYYGPNWLVWSALLRFLGRRHPPTLNDDDPLGRGRVAVGLLGYAVLAVCFIPAPIEWSWVDAWTALLEHFS